MFSESGPGPEAYMPQSENVEALIAKLSDKEQKQLDYDLNLMGSGIDLLPKIEKAEQQPLASAIENWQEAYSSGDSARLKEALAKFKGILN